MHYEGINYGILEMEIPQEFETGYLHIFPVARGKLPLPGEDGKVTELFQRRKNMRLEVQSGSEVDFNQDVQLQPIRKGSAICLIRLPRAGTDGTDVTGQELPSPQPFSPYVPQGKNTTIGRGGQALTAGVDGILYIENEQFCIHEQKIIDGNLDQFQGTLRISGNLYIGGNVDGVANVELSRPPGTLSSTERLDRPAYPPPAEPSGCKRASMAPRGKPLCPRPVRFSPPWWSGPPLTPEPVSLRRQSPTAPSTAAAWSTP